MKARTKVRRKQTRRGVRWYVVLVDDDGEHAHGGHRTQREAKAAAAALLTDSSRGRYIPPAKMTVADYLAEWLEARRNADLSPNTREVERITIRSQILPYIGEVTLQRLSPKDIDRMDAALRERGLRGKTRRNARGTLHKALADAVRRGYVLANVADAVDPPAKDDSVQRGAWSAEEVRVFLELASTDRFSAVWRLVLASGLRRGELCGLQWDDVNGSRISVRRQVLVRPGRSWDEDRIYVRETTKSRRTRMVNVDEGTAAALRHWKARQAAEQLAFGEAYSGEGWIVAEADGSLVQPDTLSARWKRLERMAGVRPIGLHGARHTHATLSLAAGARLEVVSRQLGHASIAITADVYGHPDDDAAAAAAARLGAVLPRGGIAHGD